MIIAEMIKILEENECNLLSVYCDRGNENDSKLKVNRDWTVRDELAHIVSWLEEFEKEIQFLLFHPGETLPWEVATDSSPTGYDKWNKSSLINLQGLNSKDLLRRYSEGSARLRDILRSLKHEQLIWVLEIPWEGLRTIPDLIRILSDHEKKHVQRSKRKLRGSS